MKKKSGSTQRFKVVKKRLADGSIKEYRYPVKDAGGNEAHRIPAQGTVDHILRLYWQSIEFRRTRPNTQKVRRIYLQELDVMSEMPIHDVKRRNILTIRDMLAISRGSGAANAFLAVSRVFFGWAISRDWIEINPTAGVKHLPSTPLPTWTPEIVQKAMEQLNPSLRRVIVLALFTGQRRSDLCRMKWSHISEGFICVSQEKTGAILKIPVHPTLARYLKEWPHESEFILTNSRSAPWIPNSLTLAMNTASHEGKIPRGFNVHGLRKMSATLLAEAGCSIHEIASITGHRTLAMVQHYTLAANQEKLAKDAIMKMDTSFLTDKETGM